MLGEIKRILPAISAGEGLQHVIHRSVDLVHFTFVFIIFIVDGRDHQVFNQ